MKLAVIFTNLLFVALLQGCRNDDLQLSEQRPLNLIVQSKENCQSPGDTILDPLAQVSEKQEARIRAALRRYCDTHPLSVAKEVWGVEGIVCKLMTKQNDSYWLVPIERDQNTLRDYLLLKIDEGIIIATCRIPGHWIEQNENGWPEDYRFLSPPLFREEDVNHDGIAEFIIKDRRHNGNSVNVAVELIFGVRGRHLKLLGRHEYICDDWSRGAFLHRTWYPDRDCVAVYASNCAFPKNKRFVGSFEAYWEPDTVLFQNPSVKDSLFSQTLIFYDGSI